MLGVQKNFRIQRKISSSFSLYPSYIHDFFLKRDYKMNTVDLKKFTVFIKTIVAFTQYNIKMFVYFICNFLFNINSFFLTMFADELSKIIQIFRVALTVILIDVVLSFLLAIFLKNSVIKIIKSI
jgi:ABC-type phosphate/phosphonate transport system permease subunit